MSRFVNQPETSKPATLERIVRGIAAFAKTATKFGEPIAVRSPLNSSPERESAHVQVMLTTPGTA